jgi:NADH-quinone oxidoreductase subunit C
MPTVTPNEAVLAAHANHPAIQTLQQNHPGALQGAIFDRDELTLAIARDQIIPACRAVQQAGFNFLADVTCVDLYPAQPRFQVTYHLLSHAQKQRLRLCVYVAEADATVESITGVWPAANFYEREVFDLFGVRFNGHPDLRRIMLPEDFSGHPLRKDFPVEGYR